MPVSTLTDGMSTLKTSWGTLTTGVLRGECAFWIGSGISRNQFPDVPTLLMEVLRRLHAGITPDPNCPYKKALNAIMELTPIRDLSIAENPDSWPAPRKKELIEFLQEKYSDVLEQDVRLPTGTSLITWDLLKLQEIYGDPTKKPDAEHRFIALLVEEGLISELLTTNWDALIELAHEECRGSKPLTMQSVASSSEWSRNGFLSRLIKIHGCARKARANEGVYRRFLVATRTDIHNWLGQQQFEPFKTAFRAILREKTAFFVGLSAQDWNIQSQCSEAAFGQEQFALVPQKVYFAEPQIRNSQRAILKAIYGQNAYNGDAENIESKAIVPIFAKTLFGSLYLLTLAEKAHLVAGLPNVTLTTEYRDLMNTVLQQMGLELQSRYDSIADENTRWRTVANEVPYFLSRLLKMFRTGSPPSNWTEYDAIANKHLGQLEQTHHEVLDLQWLLFALSVLREGVNRTYWKIQFSAALDGNLGQFQLSNGTKTIPVFLLQNDTGLLALMASGCIDSSTPDRSVVIYPRERKRISRRATSPARTLPGTLTPRVPHEIWLRGELEEASALTELFDSIKPEVALAFAV